MRNLKVTFHHQNFIYGFKLDLHVYENTNMINLNPKTINQNFSSILSLLILSEEEKSMFQSLSLIFKSAFLTKYNESIEKRKKLDFIGDATEKHVQYFKDKISGENKNTLEGLKEFFIYFKRVVRKASQSDLHHFRTLQFIRMFTNLPFSMQYQKQQKYEFVFYLLSILGEIVNLLMRNEIQQETTEIDVIDVVIEGLQWVSREYENRYMTELYILAFQMFQQIWKKNDHNNELLYKILPKTNTSLLKFIISLFQTNNIVITSTSVCLVLKILQHCQNMTTLLLFITQCIAAKLTTLIEQIYQSVKFKRYLPINSISMTVPDDSDIGRKVKKTQMIEKKYSEGAWQKYMKKTYKNILQLRERFAQFKSGKVKVKKKEANGEVKQKQKQEQKKMREELGKEESIIKRIQEMEEKTKLEELRRVQKSKSEDFLQEYELKLQQLQKQLNEALKINKWYVKTIEDKEKTISNLEQTISQFIYVKKKHILKAGISLQKQTVNLSINQNQKPNSLPEEVKVQEEPKIQKKTLLLPPPSLSETLRMKKQSQNKNQTKTQTPASIERPNLPMPPPLTLMINPLPTRNSRSSQNKNRNSSQKKSIVKKQMKKISWNPVQLAKVKDSFWETANEDYDFDEEKLIKNFSRTANKNMKELKAFQEKVVLKTMLKPERAKNVEIVLRKTRIPVEQFKQILDDIDMHFLTPDTVDSLLKIVPTPSEMDEFLQLEIQKPEEWTIADKFLSIAVKFRNFEDFLKSILFKYDFPELSTKYFIHLNNFLTFFQNLKNDTFLQTFLQFMLAIGNYMNEDSSKGNAFGFRFDSIEKTYNFIGQDQKTTLFEFVLEQMYDKGIKFPQKNYFIPSIVVPLEVLKDDLVQFNKHVAMVQECILFSDQMEKYAQFFMVFYIEAKEEICLMDSKLAEGKVLFQKVLQFYCEKGDSSHLVKVINEFRIRVGKWLEKVERRKKYKR